MKRSFACLVVATAASLEAQSWRNMTRPGPEARYDHVMSWHEPSGVGVMFGGYEYGQAKHFGATWLYDGTRWTLHSPSGGPSPRQGASMCFDSRRGVVVLFGGLTADRFNNNPVYHADTWEFDGATWRQVATTSGPSGRVTNLAFDSARGITVLIGGANRTGHQRDIWEYDGSVWTKRSVSMPRTRPGYTLAYDAARGHTVAQPRLQYGQSGPWETYLWDGQALRTAMSRGPVFSGGAMTYDSRRNLVVCVGTNFVGPAQTWEFDGTTWARNAATTGQQSLGNHSLIDATTLGSLVLFGGEIENGAFLDPTRDLYEFAQFAAVSSFGIGCATGGPVPALSSTTGSRPATGSVWSVSLDRPTPNGVLLVGISRERWGNLALPLPLDRYGIPGCRLYVSMELAIPMNGVSASLQIPPTPGLHGEALHLQGICLDLAGAVEGMSNGLTGIMGR